MLPLYVCVCVVNKIDLFKVVFKIFIESSFFFFTLCMCVCIFQLKSLR